MAIVVSKDEFDVFMGQHRFDTKLLGFQYKVTGKKPLPIKSQLGIDVVIIYSDTRVFMRGKGLYLEEILKNNKLGVHVSLDNEEAVSPSAITLQYEIRKNMKDNGDDDFKALDVQDFLEQYRKTR